MSRKPKVKRDAAEALGVGRQLERIASMIGGQVSDQQERLALPLHVVIDRESVYIDLRHVRLLVGAGGNAHASLGEAG